MPFFFSEDQAACDPVMKRLLFCCQTGTNAIHAEVQDSVRNMDQEPPSEETPACAPERRSITLRIRHVKSKELLSNRSLPRGTFQQCKIEPCAENKETKNQKYGGLAEG